MRFNFLSFIVNCSLIIAVAQAENGVDRHMEAMIDWIRSAEDGFLTEKVEVRRIDPSNSNSRFGMFATEDIRSKERLMHVPAECVLEQDQFEEANHFVDDFVIFGDVLESEMILGEDSRFAPFLDFLRTQSNTTLPAMWSTEAKDLVEMIIGNGYELGEYGWKLPVLAPKDIFDLHGVECSNFDVPKSHCMQPEMYFVAAQIIRHANFDVFTPITDMINHHNGAVNTYNTPLDGDNGFTFTASKNIDAGDQVFTSYNKNLSNRRMTRGTAEIFRDYGFVEPYPQQWSFGGGRMSFELKEVVDEDDEKTLKLSWKRQPKNKDQMNWLNQEYQRLKDLLDFEIKDAKKDSIIPETEMDAIIEYHQALLIAIKTAGKSAKDICSRGNCDEAINTAAAAVDKLDDFYKKIYQCETLTKDESYHELETVQSQYQELDYREHPETKNCCFYLDDIFQICDSYWPHYHEMFVHKPAKYIARDVKRVLWVGGGDSGLVNEIVKYPELELAVGLELDQKVTRGAFKYFGAEPHFNNEKVQWWFGDASKSLSMLPTEYFGSFDMVMVDLSDTVLAFSVSKTLDIFSALSLLLKPDGLLIMNELFFKRVSDVFKYTINYSFTGVPEIDDQNYVIGSNSIDFLKRALVDHDLNGDIFVENSIYKTKHQFDMVHDYRHNIDNTFKKLCKIDGTGDDNMEEQEASPGILMIIEAENLTADLHSIVDIQTAVVKALEGEGLNLVTASALPPSDSAYDSEATNFVIILQEGYVIVRAFPEHKHCSFDLHLWSDFNKHNGAKKALIASVGGSMDSVTSYRIVAGGMFGVSTWRDDVKSRGPKVTQKCDESSDSPSSVVLKKDPESVAIAMKAGMSLVQEKNARVAIVCGYETDSCDSIGVLEKEDNVGEVLPLYTCPGLANDVQSFEDRQSIITNCKTAIIKSLKDSFYGEERKLHAIVLDSGLPEEMGQIMLQILFATFRGQKVAPLGVLADGFLMFGIVEDETEGWRRNLLNTVRQKVILADPVFNTRVFFNTTDSSVELHITSSGDERFIEQLMDTVANVEKDAGLTLEVRHILGGYWKSEVKDIMEPWEASRYMSTKDYNHSSALKQWKSQKPLGYQTVFQLEQGEHFHVGDVVLANHKLFNREMKAEIIWVDGVNDYYTLRFTSDDDEEQTSPGSMLRLVHSRKKKSSSAPIITVSQIDDAFKKTISTVEKDMSTALIYRIENVGDGYVMIALWSGGTVVLVWDGRSHVDINFFTYEENLALADEFILRFKRTQGFLTTSLRDEQPRGRGSVVNFLTDIESSEDPRWA